MPEGFPKPEGVTDEEAARIDGFCEGLYGPVVAAYTPNEVTAGEHPQFVKDAWVGVRMPIRQRHLEYVARGNAWVEVMEAYNALVASGAGEDVLRYWINYLGDDQPELFGFNTEEGEIEYLEPHSIPRNPPKLPSSVLSQVPMHSRREDDIPF